MKNFVQPGDVVELTAPSGGVVSGTVYLIGALVVVATVTAAEGAKFNGAVLVDWMNVTAGNDSDVFGGLASELIAEGYAYVGVSAQAVAPTA